ncbi:MAG: type II toxin-antitoxin system VapC family toxin [Pseudomonadota bacterium]
MSEAYLLDTHVLIWAMFDPDQLSPTVRDILRRNGEAHYVSAVSAYEIAFKVNRGQLPGAEILANEFSGQVQRDGYLELAMFAGHAREAGMLPLHHRDPWDRILLAQAHLEGLTLLSNDEEIAKYDVSQLW